MSVPSTREPQKIAFSQITRGLNAVRFSRSYKTATLQSSMFKRHTRILRLSEHKWVEGRFRGF
jgi:hypothetical protein